MSISKHRAIAAFDRESIGSCLLLPSGDAPRRSATR